MKILPGVAWGVVTARGGSKSIPLKNLVPVAGRPLLEYVSRSARKAETLSRVLCSTDHPEIAAAAVALGIEPVVRPEHLAGDDANSIDVMVDLVRTLEISEGSVAEIVVLLQPTSLFMTSANIDDAVRALLTAPEAQSSQTVSKVPHQFHAYNQRRMSSDGRDIGFEFEKERALGHNKQAKPVFYGYGNLIATRSEALVARHTIFARPSVPIVVSRYEAFDLDETADIAMAEILITLGLVNPT